MQLLPGEDSRLFRLSFSSEAPVRRPFGHEILDHSEGAVDMQRLSEIGCVLYNHNRDEAIGRVCRVWLEDHRGLAEIELDDDPFAETIRQKMIHGTLRGVSVGYVINDVEEIRAGSASRDGFVGPCVIARRWTPHEISIVSVPADPTVGVGRDLDVWPRVPLSIYERQVQINRNWRTIK